jgi:2'-phosphotransferase
MEKELRSTSIDRQERIENLRGRKSNSHGRGSGHGHWNQETAASRALSWVLRHAAPEIGLFMTPDGYVPVEDIVAHPHRKLRVIASVDQVRMIVATNDKQRYSLAEKPAELYGRVPLAGCTLVCIRANQGHSIDFIDPLQLLRQLSSEDLMSLPTVVHGTYSESWKAIMDSGGLHRMNRQHIHLATGLPKSGNQVISGIRLSADVYIFIDTKKCATDKILFWQSENGVVLCAGKDNTGILPVQYFSHVTDKSGDVLLDNRAK